VRATVAMETEGFSRRAQTPYGVTPASHYGRPAPRREGRGSSGSGSGFAFLGTKDRRGGDQSRRSWGVHSPLSTRGGKGGGRRERPAVTLTVVVSTQGGRRERRRAGTSPLLYSTHLYT
jgi:hypothetical protein